MSIQNTFNVKKVSSCHIPHMQGFKYKYITHQVLKQENGKIMQGDLKNDQYILKTSTFF